MKTALALAAILFAYAAHAETGWTQGPPLATGIDAFPRLTATDVGAQKINAKFAAMDADEMEWLLDCDGGRGIAVTAQTADFLSMTVARDGSCEGAAHPFSNFDPLTFDLSSGAEADWQVLLPNSLLDPDAAAYDRLHPVASDALKRAYLAALPDPQHFCADAYMQPLHFALWLDASRHALAMEPSMAYVFTPCIVVAYLPLSQLQGADPRLIAALSGPE